MKYTKAIRQIIAVERLEDRTNPAPIDVLLDFTNFGREIDYVRLASQGQLPVVPYDPDNATIKQFGFSDAEEKQIKEGIVANLTNYLKQPGLAEFRVRAYDPTPVAAANRPSRNWSFPWSVVECSLGA